MIPAATSTSSAITAFTNARIIDPSCGRDEHGALLMQNGKIIACGANAHNQGIPLNAVHYDLEGKVIIPGLIDCRCFIGTAADMPQETLANTAKSAAAGGITAVIAITEKGSHAFDNAAAVAAFCKQARSVSPVSFYPAAALTKGMNGQELADFKLMQEAGAAALAEGHETLSDTAVLRRAFQYAAECNLPVTAETQEPYLSRNAVMTEGLKASLMGLPAAPEIAELIALQRDAALAQLTGVRYHAAHISTAQAADYIRKIKNETFSCSAGVSVNSLIFNESDIGEYNSAYRFFPPLRAAAAREHLIAALADGTLDIITSCHEPRSFDAKNAPFAEAATGAVGLQTLLPAALRLYHEGHISLLRLIDALSTRPAKVFNLQGGNLQIGAAADFAVLDLERPWIFTQEMLLSACKNTVFDNAFFQGSIIATIIGGEIFHNNGLH